MKRAQATYHLTAKARQRYAERLFDLKRVASVIEQRASEGYRDARVYQVLPFDLRDLPPAKRLESWLDENCFTYAWCPTPQLVDPYRPMRQDDYPELVVRW
ncbi:hypothetical protein [Oceaniradius stylonematis]|uniref:hypothetical protein n=1 Tax=Oceaniradius stylonematis TaxID=2184161 RepID=UPI003C79861B